ncbi:WSCD family member AAEL009094-like [Hyposmocoma kahamanoa]|uniref:WSCD family member AAEL009094-like n=1 Tax=Hyposmocoma kahamanoa TaxID=1477025 RepID=UPI000E6D6209|nr:WSCD family member AAEL009094-like [Hyposmocoma kahamanoa]
MSMLFTSYVFITSLDERYFRLPLQDIPTVEWCKELRNISEPRNPVCLISGPGSGNTWLRYLLQQATGIITGSVYKDESLLMQGFPGESRKDGSVLLVKSHGPMDFTSNLVQFDSVVLLIRNPKDSILAAFNVMYGLHLKLKENVTEDVIFHNMHNIHDIVAPPSIFGEFGGNWSRVVNCFIIAWTALYTEWLTKYHGPMHVVFYENLVEDTRNELQAILDFLNVTVSSWDITCAIHRKSGLDNLFRHVKKYKYFNPFTKDMYEKMELAQNKVYDLVK